MGRLTISHVASANAPRRSLSGMCLLLLAIVVIAAPAAVSQPAFEADLATFRADRGEQPRLDLHLQVPNAGLQFVRRDSGFTAGYVVGVTVYRAGRSDRPDGLVMTRSWNRRVQASSYEQTVDGQHFDRSAYSLEVPSGRYVVRVRVEDSVSGRASTRDVVTDVLDVAGNTSMSDLLIVESYDARTRSFAANAARLAASSDNPLAIYYEVYLSRPERLRIEYVVQEAAADRRRGGILGFILGRRGQEPGNTVFQVVEPMAVTAGRNPIHRRLPADRFGPGDYQITVRVEREGGGTIAERTAAFAIGWGGVFDGFEDLDSAIAQLRYIAKDREIRAMQQAPTPEERFRLFRAFWDRRDPSPGSARNERMEEYYARVGQAIRQYGRGGWESDRGEVFIRFGEPDRVVNHSEAQGGRPYQVWYYSRMGRRFIFVEDGSSGDYRLLVPIWDERTRM